MSTIVIDKLSGNSELTDDVPFYKIFHLFLCDYYQRLSLCPLGEVIHKDDSRSYWEGTDYIDAPLHEGPRTKDGSLVFYWDISFVQKLLAFITLPYIVPRVQDNCWPKVPL